jgi:hypothetical protein
MAPAIDDTPVYGLFASAGLKLKLEAPSGHCSDATLVLELCR